MYHKKQLRDFLLDDSRPLKTDAFTTWFQSFQYDASPSSQAYAFIKNQIQSLKVFADSQLETPLKDIDFKTFMLYEKTGDRKTHEDIYFTRRKHLMTYGILSFLYPKETRYIEKLEDLIWSICKEYTWALPAHFSDAEGNAIPLEDSKNQIDLFSCETGLTLSEIIYLLSGQLSAPIQAIAKKEIKTRLLIPFLDGSTGQRFEYLDNNWSSVCGSSLGAIALYMEEDKETLISLLHRSLSSISVYLDSFGDDGICTEGVAYWTYGFGFFVIFADLLKEKTGGKLNLFDLEKAKKIAATQELSFLYDSHVISFSDAVPLDSYRVGITSYLQRTYPDIKVPNLTCAKAVYEDSCYRFALSLRDFIWFSPETSYGLEDHMETYMPQAQWYIKKWEDTCLVVKGGHNLESHNHNDVGSFILFNREAPLFCDLGAGEYDRDYFSENRYLNPCTHSGNHSLPVINGHLQSPGLSYRAKDILYLPQEGTFSLDLHSCYEDPTLLHFNRRFKSEMKPNHHFKAIHLRDTFSFSTESTFTEHFVTRQKVEIQDKKVTIHIQNTSVELIYDEAKYHASVENHNFINHHHQKDYFTLIKFSLRVPAISEVFDLGIAFT